VLSSSVKELLIDVGAQLGDVAVVVDLDDRLDVLARERRRRARSRGVLRWNGLRRLVERGDGVRQRRRRPRRESQPPYFQIGKQRRSVSSLESAPLSPPSFVGLSRMRTLGSVGAGQRVHRAVEVGTEQLAGDADAEPGAEYVPVRVVVAVVPRVVEDELQQRRERRLDDEDLANRDRIAATDVDGVVRAGR
jgi:hypothetical protein